MPIGTRTGARRALARRDAPCPPLDLPVCQEGIGNRTEPAEPNRTEPFHSGTGRNRTRKRTEANRTEPRRVLKAQAEPRRTGTSNFPNRTEPMNFREVRNRNESNPNRFLPCLWMRSSLDTPTCGCARTANLCTNIMDFRGFDSSII